jgi:predicted DCC family thiol-disulfide oxidoreductase YuxK
MEQQEIMLVFDKQCPACTYYSRFIRIREQLGEIKIVDARDAGMLMDEITGKGWDIDEGMVLKMGPELYYGSDAIHALALISSRSGIFNRFNYWVFKSRLVSKVLYPVLRSLRNLLLKLLGISRINNLGIDGNDKF